MTTELIKILQSIHEEEYLQLKCLKKLETNIKNELNNIRSEANEKE